jgi:hypothetical protein
MTALQRSKRLPAGYRYLRAGEVIKSGDLFRSKFPDHEGNVWRQSWGTYGRVKSGGLRYCRAR